MKAHPETVYTPDWLNYGLFLVGMSGVWLTTHSLVALLFTWIASIHIVISKGETK